MLFRSFQVLIKPKYYRHLNRRVSKLTGIKETRLKEEGIPFPEAWEKFRDFCGEDFRFMTWSMSDMPMLVDNMLLHGIDVSCLPVCYDIQRVFGREIMRSSTRYALDVAINILGEKGDVAHDALHDAKNTAKVCNHLDLDAEKLFFI